VVVHFVRFKRKFPVFLIVIYTLVVYAYLFIYFGLEFRREADCQ